jgi:hypothetical protein
MAWTLIKFIEAISELSEEGRDHVFVELGVPKDRDLAELKDAETTRSTVVGSVKYSVVPLKALGAVVFLAEPVRAASGSEGMTSPSPPIGASSAGQQAWQSGTPEERILMALSSAAAGGSFVFTAEEFRSQWNEVVGSNTNLVLPELMIQWGVNADVWEHDWSESQSILEASTKRHVGSFC